LKDFYHKARTEKVGGDKKLLAFVGGSIDSNEKPLILKGFGVCLTTPYLNQSIKTALSHRPAILKRILSDDKETAKTSKENLYGENIKMIGSIAQKQKYLNVEEINLLIAAYLGGKSVYALAEQFGCHRTTVSNVLKKHDVTVTKKKTQRKINVM